MQKIIALLVSGLMLAACASSEETPDPSRLGYDFVPLEVGSYTDYDVFQVTYPFDQVEVRPDTQRYQLRELVADTITTLNREKGFVIHRLTRQRPTQTWRLDSAWLAWQTPGLFMRKENNVDYIKLPLPPRDGLTWNGNQFNNFRPENYTVSGFDQPYELKDTTYPRTVTVVQSDESNAVLTDQRLEVYARGTGLVFKKRVQIRYRQQGGTVGGNVPESGIYLTQTIRKQ
ncbi:MAG: hypothetical protein MUD08_11025 [Cytophagales bacterium]|nr:hypothetical protein [Cytophagales bacterium]